jgi:hypothetical protein
MSMPRMLFACLLFVSFGRLAAAEESSHPLTEVCEKRETDLKNVDETLKAQVAQGCRDAVEDGIKTCFKESELSDEEKSTVEFKPSNMLHGARDMHAANELGRNKNLAQAEKCDQARAKVHDACSEMIKGYSKAMADNRRDQSDRQAEILQMPAGAAQREAMQDNWQTHRDVDQQLQEQRTRTDYARGAAERALTDSTQCAVNQARVYASALTKTDDTLASIGAEDDGTSTHQIEEPEEPVRKRVVEKTQEVSSSSVSETVAQQAELYGASAVEGSVANKAAEGLATGAKVAGKAVGGALVVNSAREGDFLGTATGVAQTGAEWLLSPKAALRFSGVGTFVTVMFTPSETSHCDVGFADALAAYNAGCAQSAAAMKVLAEP